MSHTTKLSTISITDMEALADAVMYLKENGVNLELRKNARPRMYYPQQEVLCDWVIHLKNSRFDIGLQKQSDGSYVPIFDAWDNEIRRQVGAPMNVSIPDTVEEIQMLNISKVVDLYGVMAARNQLVSEGYGYFTEVTYNEDEDAYVLEVGKAY